MKWNKIPLMKEDGELVEGPAPVIVSASRATDIPAFYAGWFVERLKKGYVEWRNPFNGTYSYVGFRNTRLVVFWSKNPRPMIEYLDYLEERELNYYFQFTLNDYDRENLEPNVPHVGERIETFQRLSERIGAEKVIWRFDPLILTDEIGGDELLRKVEKIGNQLKGFTRKLVFSFADIRLYKKVRSNLQKQAVRYRDFTQQDMEAFASGLQRLNESWQFELATCAEPVPLEKYGIVHNKCIDDDLIIKLFSHDKALMDLLGIDILPGDLFNPRPIIVKTKNNTDKGQRQFCGCIVSKDIGAYNTCPHLCKYCYANASEQSVLRNWEGYKKEWQ